MDRIFKGRPETRIENPDYLDGLTETLEALTDEELEWVSDVRNGIQTRCKFLPTPADLFDLIREKAAARDKCKPAFTTWRNFDKETGPWDEETDYERKQSVVTELLGYNPEAKNHPIKRKLTPATTDDLASLKSKLPPPGPATRELLNLIASQGTI